MPSTMPRPLSHDPPIRKCSSDGCKSQMLFFASNPIQTPTAPQNLRKIALDRL